MPISILLVAAQAASQPATDARPAEDTIVVTASRVPQEQAESPASTTVIEREWIERLGAPLLHSLLRLTPSISVASSGPAGSLTEVRIRGSEANHTLLFIDGIRANDPAAGNTPRFELLNADIASRVEIVRGPQSALWGSEAIGGVVAVNGVAQAPGAAASAEAGSFGFRRASASGAVRSPRVSLTGAIGGQQADGIDSFDGQGDRDGYRNLSARLRGTWRVAPTLAIGASGFLLRGRSEYDGVDLVTFVHSDTLDVTKNSLGAGRLWIEGGNQQAGLSGRVGGSYLSSSNRNFLDEDELNRTAGRRWTADWQLQYRASTGAVAHSAIVAVEYDRESFRARDEIYFGATDQDQRRSHGAVTAEWRAEVAPAVVDIAVRRDIFSRFDDATTLRASALIGVGSGFAVAGSYGEGIAQPTFFDLYGFFPGSFVGNPALKPESSRGVEASLRYRSERFEGALTAFQQRLHDEIVDVFDPVTFQSTTVNRESTSRRFGAEVEAGWQIGSAARLTANYAFLRATEPESEGRNQRREARRPRHSGSIALDGTVRAFSYGAAVSYTGARADTDFDVFPARRVRLGSYWLASARVGYALTPRVELFARASNLFDVEYEEAVGYRTEGRGLFAGVRLKSR